MSQSIFDEENGVAEEFIQNHYKQEVAELANEYPTRKWIEIDYTDIEKYAIDLADDINKAPKKILPALEQAIQNTPVPVNTQIEDVKVRVINTYPNKSIDELRSEDIGSYLSVTGLVEEVTQVSPEVQQAVWECLRCGSTTTTQTVGDQISEPKTCQGCEREGPFHFLEANSKVRDKQLIKLQPLPEEVGGNTNNSLNVMAYWDLAGVVSPGDRLRVNGTLEMDTDNIVNESNPDAMREMYLRANGFEKDQESFEELEPERKEEIKTLAQSEDLFGKFRRSFAPHILTEEYGDLIKLAIILQLFGGVRRTLPSGVTRKGDINVLMVGEPGTGKSQFINQAQKIAPKGVKASGKGATAAGLTATAEKSELTGSWTLKAGALVQANNGFVGIDEFDKMTDGARKSMHEALEDQQIPINKAGMNVTLPAKCSVLAGANPKYGRYDRYEAVSEQIDLGSALLSRFDLIFSLTDRPDADRDKEIAKHQLKSNSEELEPEIEIDLLRQYIAYAKQNYEPEWPDNGVKDTIAEYYADIRQEASQDSNMAPGARMNDALRRYSEASARARLSDTIEKQDVERATKLMDFHIGQVALNEDGEISAEQFDGSESIEKQKQQEYEQLKPKILDVMGDTEMFIDEIAREVKEREDTIENYINRLKETGDVYEPNPGKYRKT